MFTKKPIINGERIINYSSEPEVEGLDNFKKANDDFLTEKKMTKWQSHWGTTVNIRWSKFDKKFFPLPPIKIELNCFSEIYEAKILPKLKALLVN